MSKDDCYAFSSAGISDFDDKNDCILNDHERCDVSAIKLSYGDYGQRNNIVNLVDWFEYAPVDSDINQHFLENYKQALLGESDSWKLDYVQISHHYMRLSFFNRKFYQKNRADSDYLPYYDEALEINLKNYDIADGDVVDFRFELPNKDGDVSKERIIAFGANFTEITELGFGKKRTIRLPGYPIDEDGFCRVVSVAECCQ